MTMLSSAFNVFGATGVREDLTDWIDNISPTDTPAYSTFAKGKATNTYHEWQTDALAAAAANAQLEGDIFTNLVAARTPTNRYGNRTQIFTKAFTITTSMDAVNTAGRAKESAYQTTKAMKELKNDYELAIFDWSAAATGGAGSTTKARMLTSLHHWVVNVTGSTGYSGVSAVTITGNMTGLTIAEGTFNLILNNMWDQGARPNAVYVKGPLKRLISGWATSTSRVWDGSKKITNTADVYESDFGLLEMKLERYAASSIGYILDESKWGIASLSPTQKLPQGRRGLGDDYLIFSEWTLEARNPTGNGLFISAG